jgi:hypothetical protein
MNNYELRYWSKHGYGVIKFTHAAYPSVEAIEALLRLRTGELLPDYTLEYEHEL